MGCWLLPARAIAWNRLSKHSFQTWLPHQLLYYYYIWQLVCLMLVQFWGQAELHNSLYLTKVAPSISGVVSIIATWKTMAEDWIQSDVWAPGILVDVRWSCHVWRYWALPVHDSWVIFMWDLWNDVGILCRCTMWQLVKNQITISMFVEQH